MKLLLIFALACFPLLCLGAPSISYTSYFNNVHVYTNITLGGVTRNTWPSSGGIAGTVINTGASTAGAVPVYTDTTGTNVASSTAFTLTDTNSTLTGVASANQLVATNGVHSLGTGTGGGFVGHPSSSATWWGSSDFSGLSFIDFVDSSTAPLIESYLGAYMTAAPTTVSYLNWIAGTNSASYVASRNISGSSTARAQLGVDSSSAFLGFGVNFSDTFLLRDAANTLAMRNGTAAQTNRVYGTFTDAANLVRYSLEAQSSTINLKAETFGTGADNIPISIISAGTSGVILQGTGSNDSAASGKVGEYSSTAVSSASATGISTGSATNVTSLSLTAGDWDVEGNVNFIATSATITVMVGGITTTSATIPTDGTEINSGVRVTTTSINDSVTIPRKRISIAATTTVYLVGSATFSAGTMKAGGSLTARRAR